MKKYAYEFMEVKSKRGFRLPDFKEKTMVTCPDCEQPKHPLTICYSHYCIQRRRFEGKKESKL